MAQGGLAAPAFGSGIGGRVLSTDLIPEDMVSNVGGNDYVNIRVLASDIAALIPQPPAPEVKEVPAAGPAFHEKPASVDIPASQGAYKEIPVKGVRKVVAERMHSSLLTTSQLTLNASADATAILAYRKKCKADAELAGITINDSVMYAVVQTLKEFKELNAYMLADKIIEFESIHLGFAVDTPRGLMVPVIKNADKMTIKELSAEAKKLGKACQDGTIDPDLLSGGTFTVTNLGAAGIESFTPVLNAPQVGILGVCAVQLKPVMADDEVKFVPHMGLSLTFDHCAVDGAPGARFLVELKKKLAEIGE
jgi:pyruvate dehydrogenase E2 component (dihydrolipoamide acetyltransferase)